LRQRLGLFFNVSVAGTHTDTILPRERYVNDRICIYCPDSQLMRLLGGGSLTVTP
jgi:hypothetical protein